MKLVHVSDTHGRLDELLDGDVVVHSGDFLPNLTRTMSPVAVEEEAFQIRWLEENGVRLRDWIGSRPFVFCRGNHDFVDPVPLLRDAGIDAIDASDRFVSVGGVGFAGFPYVPWFRGIWWGEISEQEIGERLASGLSRHFSSGAVDVFVTHGPIHGVLDRSTSGEHCGSRAVCAFLEALEVLPRVVLCGHIHEAAGVVPWSGVFVSNAAATQRVIDVGGRP